MQKVFKQSNNLKGKDAKTDKQERQRTIKTMTSRQLLHMAFLNHTIQKIVLENKYCGFWKIESFLNKIPNTIPNLSILNKITESF